MSDSGSEYEYEEEIVEEIVTTKGGARHKALPVSFLNIGDSSA